MQLKPIDQQVVAVVGASSGIGRETALQFAKRKAKVIVAARSELGLASLVDELLTGFDAQKTSQPKSEDIPDNLFAPLQGFDKVEGDFSSKTQRSVSTWLDTHPTAKWGAVASLLLGMSVLAFISR